MSSSLSPSRGVILEQLQCDAPRSPLVGHLRSRLAGSEYGALPSENVRSGGIPLMNPSVCSDSEPNYVSVPPASQIGLPQGATSEIAADEGPRVKAHSRRPISADFLNSSSEALQTRSPAANAGNPGTELRRELNGSSSSFSGSSGSGRPESYVLVHNVAKRHNLGTIARSATAFGVSELILVGRKDFNAFGSHGASLHMQFRHFHTLPEAALYLKRHWFMKACSVDTLPRQPGIQAKDVDICGVEITEGAKAVHKHPFTRSTAFVLGNEGTGLSKKEMDICSFFVYIPQCGSGTASLNVTVAASIVLHHFSVWAGFAEREREGQKFIVAERPVRRTPRNVVEDPEAVKERRRQKVDYGLDDWLVCDGEVENESDEATEGNETGTIQFPNSNKSGLLSSLNSLYC